MITVGKLDLDFRMKEQTFAHRLYGEWDSFCRHAVEKVIDDTLSPFDTDETLIEIEELVVTLPVIEEGEFYDRFPVLLAKTLYEQFTGLLHKADDPTQKQIKIIPSETGMLETLIFFLRYGYLPAATANEYEKPFTLFRTLMRTGKTEWKYTFLTEWRRPSFRKRMVMQFKDAELEDFVAYINKEEAPFVHLFTRVTIKAQPLSEYHTISQTAYREVVWIFTLSYLMKENIGVFNRRQFVVYTIRELAAHYNLSYEEVLSSIFLSFQKGDEMNKSEELLSLLTELHDEVDAMKKNVPDNREASTGPAEAALSSAKVKAQRGGESQPAATGKQDTDMAESGISAEKMNADSKGINTDSNEITGNELSILLKRAKADYPVAGEEAAAMASVKPGMDDRPVSRDNREVAVPASHQGGMADSPGNFYKENNIHSINDQNRNDMANNGIKPGEQFAVDNAGLMLLSPYLGRLFKMANLTEDNKFVSHDARIRAVFMLQQIVFDKTDDYDESRLLLNKLIVGLPIEEPLPRSLELTEEEMQLCGSLLEGAKGNWPKMKNSSVLAFREAFLMRNGVLEMVESGERERWELSVEERAFDMLLDSLPWAFHHAKFPWSERFIEVKWRNR